ncbi:hypothetical protein B0A55_11048, partial [Friedmanniomyces simplex]
MLLFAATALLLLAPWTEGAVPDGYLLHEARPHAARSLIKRHSTLRSDAVIPIKIGLTQQNLDEGISHLINVSHPTSTAYGKHLSVHEVNDLFSPADTTVAAVRKWLANATNMNETSIHVSKNGWLVAQVPVHAAERAFATRYYEYEDLNALGFYEAGDYYAQADLNAFFTQYAPNVPNGTAPVPAFIDGAQAPVAVDDPTNTGESDIDLDMAFSLVYPQSVVLYQTDDRPQANLTGI